MLKDIFIIIPTQHSVHVGLVQKLIKWSSMGASVNFTTELLIDNARNGAVRAFMQTDKKYLLFIDSDVIPEIDAVERLLKHDKPIISGFYPMVRGQGEVQQQIVGGMQEIDLVPTGLLLIKREVFEKVQEPWFEFIYDDKHRNFIGEDYSFCQKATDKGIKIWRDNSIIAKHYRAIYL